ncbi:hypothetical protein F5Y15DRAFT_401526 [Xylariaceae sp. FL0016]|nr:hypothetical protein F5Y15DRAFT_401526 [Xylariaceae sp. FL0016]
MSRRPGKSRAASSKAFTSFGTAPTSSFTSFSTNTAGTNLSYLAEPPDFSSISDANVIISLKNLQKKDATTKAKALEDLVAYTHAHPHEEGGGVEEPVLEAWVQIYPRVSIDNSRRVRELSHALQFELMKSARKRMERHVPKIVASWLAGTFDKDRPVARVATEGLSSFLTTPEKLALFWKRCQQQILDYASEAIKETPDTLSDQRSTSADDAEAKYHRVVAGGLALVLNLLQKLEPSDVDKCIDSYDQFFEDNKVWVSITVNDTVVRRLACQLLSVCLEKRPGQISADLARLSKVFVAEGLKSNQTGSATDYIIALTQLTQKYPTVWTEEYRGKKSPASRLRIFLEKGSQGGASKYWVCLGQIFQYLPHGLLPEDSAGASDFLKSVRLGITSRDEPRSNVVDAWSTYLSLARQFMKTIQPSEARLDFVQDNIFPLTAHYLFPSPDTAIWSSGSQIPILIKAFTSTSTSPYKDIVDATKVLWRKLKDKFSDRIRISLPEASKDFQRSQASILDEGRRWFTFTGKILAAHEMTVSTDRPIPDLPTEPSLELLQDSLRLLKTRDWKPFGAASIVESAFREAPALFKSPPNGAHTIFQYLEDSLAEGKEDFLLSPAAPHIFSSITLMGQIAELQQHYERVWMVNVNAIMSCLEVPESVAALNRLLSSQSATVLAKHTQNLQTELVKKCLLCATGYAGSSWELFQTILKFHTLTEPASKKLVEELSSRLVNSLGQPNPGVIRGLRMIAQEDTEILFRDEETHMTIMTGLLSLSERSVDSADLLTLQSLMDDPSSGRSRVLCLVQQNINTANTSSLTVDTVVQQAMQSYRTDFAATNHKDQEDGPVVLLPKPEKWTQELSSILEETPDPSLALTNSLGGAFFLPTTTSTTPNTNLKRDSNNCAIPGRMAMYTAKLLASGFDYKSLPLPLQVETIINLGVTAELASDQLTVLSDHKIWDSLTLDTSSTEAESLVFSARKVIASLTEGATGWRDGVGSTESVLVHTVVQTLLEKCRELTPTGLYCSRVLNGILQSLTERHGFPSSGEQWLAELGILKTSQHTVFPATAILGGLGETISASRAVSNFCNRLVSDIAGAKLGEEKSLMTLTLLNATMQVYDVGELPVANNRLVFAVKNITSWLESPDDLDYRFAAEACRSLHLLLPCVKDVYGSYWEYSVDFCIYLWTKQTLQSLNCRLPEIHASLRLMSALESLEEPNDDLVDVLQSSAAKRSSALINLLKLPREKNTQPLEIVDSIICRQIERVPLHHVKDLSELYDLIASDSRSIQTAAFLVLHKALPAVQEQVSVDVLLEKQDARLPDELLSLLLDAPTLDSYPDDTLANFPNPVRSYLLSWHLVFDAFEAASFKVRSDYSEILKAKDCITPLMDFMFDVLGHSVAQGLNLDKVGFTSDHIRKYDLKLADSETGERNMQWLLAHIYYLVLKFVPGLFKSWYMDCRSKQTKIAVAAWMTKFFSPIIVSEALDDVTMWNDSQEAPEDGMELLVKVSRAAREVIAGYEVDELQAAIAIRIPQGFPLEPVTVVGTNRVAVNERKWQSWIMTTQGVITFSGGSIIDGLTAFRRNVVGALKGQTECAICYSIISSDKKMPDKRCQTCKNLFHRTCLYKWFQSSSQNTCPLCRNPIDYLGADTRARRA